MNTSITTPRLPSELSPPSYPYALEPTTMSFPRNASFYVILYFDSYVNNIGPVRFAEKTSRNIVPADLLWEKNTVPAEKTS